MKRLTMGIVTAAMGVALLVSGGCCHMHRHHADRGAGKGCACDCSCKKQSCCDKAPAADAPCKNPEGCAKVEKK